jgi:hypothetical protein
MGTRWDDVSSINAFGPGYCQHIREDEDDHRGKADFFSRNKAKSALVNCKVNASNISSSTRHCTGLLIPEFGVSKFGAE